MNWNNADSRRVRGTSMRDAIHGSFIRGMRMALQDRMDEEGCGPVMFAAGITPDYLVMRQLTKESRVHVHDQNDVDEEGCGAVMGAIIGAKFNHLTGRG